MRTYVPPIPQPTILHRRTMHHGPPACPPAHAQGRVEVDVGLGAELLSKYTEVSEAVFVPCRRALDDVHAGLDTMAALGGGWMDA